MTGLLSALLLAHLANALPASGPAAKLTGALATLARLERESPAKLAEYCAAHPALSNPESLRVVLELQPGETPRLPAGVQVEISRRDAMQVRLKASDLIAIASLSAVHHIREPWFPSPKTDPVVSDGYNEVMVQDWHDDDVTGAGVRVGIVDVGFLGYEELLGVELPAEVDAQFEHGAPDSSRHGAAVAEVIHDFAPDAELVLASFGTDMEFGQALQIMLDENVNVVNASIGFDNVWHTDGTSPVTQYADQAADAGLVFVGAAGNENQRYRVGELEYEPDTQYVRVAGKYAPLVKAPGGQARVSFRWSEPFGEAATDLDLLLVNPSDQRECGRSENPQDGDDYPFEEVIVEGCEEEVYAVVFSPTEADVSGLTGYLYASYGMVDGEATSTESLTLPADCFLCLAVGAYDPALNDAADYSSRGPTNDGRIKPDLVAPTNVQTASMEDFSGSSAATPHVAGLVALYLDRTNEADEPELAIEWARSAARDLGANGDDNTSGFGLATGDTLPPEGCSCETNVRAPLWAALLLAVAGCRRRAPAIAKRVSAGRAGVAPAIHGWPMFFLGLSAGCVPDGVDGQFVLLEGLVINEADIPVDGASVDLFLEDGTELGNATSDADGAWSFPILATNVTENRLEAHVTAENYADGYGGWDVNLLTDERTRLKSGPMTTWEGVSRSLAPLRLALAGDFAQFSGQLVDPFGTPASGVSLVVQTGWDASVGAPVVSTATTAVDGTFTVSVGDPGLYTVYSAPLNGWGGTRFPALATATGTSLRAVIAPLQAPGQLITTLCWIGETDLDLHLTAPERTEDGAGVEDRFHIWSKDTVHPDRLVNDETYVAEFLHGAEDGPGPESIRINTAPGVGLVHFSAFDMSNQSAVDSTVLAKSDALVQWWNGEDIPRYDWINPLSAGTDWMPAQADPRTGLNYAVEQYDDDVDPTDADAF